MIRRSDADFVRWLGDIAESESLLDDDDRARVARIAAALEPRPQPVANAPKERDGDLPSGT